MDHKVFDISEKKFGFAELQQVLRAGIPLC